MGHAAEQRKAENQNGALTEGALHLICHGVRVVDHTEMGTPVTEFYVQFAADFA